MSAHALAAYLSARPRTIAYPVVVRIGRTTYEGAYFSQVRDHAPGTRAYGEAVRDGRPPIYWHSGLKLLGQLPASRGRATYVADGTRYYIGGWWSTTPETFQPRASVREADGTTRAQTFADVAQHHYADASGAPVPYFDLYVDRDGSTAYGERGAELREMAISISRLPRVDRFVVVPASYVGVPDATLTLETPDGERGDMTLYAAGRVVARGEGFGAPQAGPSLLEMTDERMAGTFGSFLSHALESSEDGARAGWSVLTDDASEWTDALSLMEESFSALDPAPTGWDGSSPLG